MFEKGEYVYYGTAGVCKVNDICSSPFGVNDGKLYYMLVPNDFDNGTVIYAPAEGGAVMIRPIMTAEEAEKLLSDAKSIAPLFVNNEKNRREDYRNTLKKGKPAAIASIIKTIYLRKAGSSLAKKRISEVDAEFDKIARRALLGELASALGITSAEAEERLNTALEG